MAHASDSIELRVFRALCKRFKSKSFRFSLARDDILSRTIDPRDYEDAELFAKDYLLYSFLRKWKGWGTASQAKSRAIATWIDCEKQNKRTNDFLSRWALSCRDARALNVISDVQRKIESIIGPEPPMTLVMPLCKWGPGATASVRRSRALVQVKISDDKSVTPDCWPLISDEIDPVWWEASASAVDPVFVRANRCVTVPKTALTDRMIAAEPTLNGFVQQGIGRFFRLCLKRHGVDLDDQTVNQDLAFHALADGLATIDLSNASDTLSIEAVRLLLPPAWFDLLNRARSHFSTLEGRTYKLEKFSSMGNAFTFELESLVFFACCKAVSTGTVSVYGDDIIIPQVDAQKLVSLLTFLGFSINEDKSYVTGNFFESCGKHYFKLEPVTPAFQKEVVRDLGGCIRLHNRLYRWGVRVGMHLVTDALALVRSFADDQFLKRSRGRPLPPEIPDFCSSDEGFLVKPGSLRVDRNGDYRCRVLLTTIKTVDVPTDRHELALYALKLRTPETLNGDPRGYTEIKVGERHVLNNNVVVWASRTTSG